MSTANGGRTPLAWAAWNGHEGVVKLLLDRGADIEWKDQSGQTKLVYAIVNGHVAIVKLLLNRGANIESKDYDSGTPLGCTIAYRHEAVIKLLLEGNLVLNLASNLAVWTISQGLIFSPSGTRFESSEG